MASSRGSLTPAEESGRLGRLAGMAKRIREKNLHGTRKMAFLQVLHAETQTQSLFDIPLLYDRTRLFEDSREQLCVLFTGALDIADWY